MKKLIAVFAIAVFAVAAALAQEVKEQPKDAAAALAEARAFSRSNGWSNAVEQLARYDAVLAEYPDAPADVVFSAQYGRFISYYRMSEWNLVITLGQAILRDFPDARQVDLINIATHTANVLIKRGDYAAAQALCVQALRDYPLGGETLRAIVQSQLGDALAKQSKHDEANAAYMTLVRDYAWHYDIPDEKHIIWRAFEAINPSTIDAEIYRAFLTDVIKAVKATETNARFLGRVKSEVEKLK